MTMFSHAAAGGGFLAAKQVFPLDYEADVSQRLLNALSSGDLRSASDLLADPSLDVNFVGAVSLKLRKTEVFSRDESPVDVRVVYEDFKADVTPLFLAVPLGNVAFVRKLLSMGADVNQKLFRGFATTAAVREGQFEILEILLKAGASQPACEEALLESSRHGWARSVELLMGTDLIRPDIVIHAFITACSRGFNDVVSMLIKCGVDVNATHRVLLVSSKPSLHANIDCTALAAAVVSRQVSIVRMLLEAGARTDVKVRLGAWSWDTATGEEIRVGAGLGEPYALTWCAVEYFESTGAILQMLLEKLPLDVSHNGRCLLHHAILCTNPGAVNILIALGADIECCVRSISKTEFHPIHMASRLGSPLILHRLIEAGCDLNSRTDAGETALMICTRHTREDCLKLLAAAGADFGLVSNDGSSVASIATRKRWSFGLQRVALSTLKEGKLPNSSNPSVFSPLMFAARLGDTEALKILIARQPSDLDFQDNEKGYTAAMIAALEGHVEAFQLLVYAGANVKLCSTAGETVITLSQISQKRDLFDKAMLEYALKMDGRSHADFYALHCAVRRSDVDAIKLLTDKGYDVNVADREGYTPLMLAAKEGHGHICQLLISRGASCDAKSLKGETALSLARKSGGKENDAESVILDELARKLVLHGARVVKHTKGGRGNPHGKTIRILEHTGVLQWGNSKERNVVCREAEVGPSESFRKSRRGKGDVEDPGLFWVVTTRNKEVHFVCGEGGREEAELWVRGIKCLAKNAKFGGK